MAEKLPLSAPSQLIFIFCKHAAVEAKSQHSVIKFHEMIREVKVIQLVRQFLQTFFQVIVYGNACQIMSGVLFCGLKKNVQWKIFSNFISNNEQQNFFWVLWIKTRRRL